MAEAKKLFTDEWAQAAFPAERTGAFFEALYGGAEEGAFDIRLRFVGEENGTYEFSFDLIARPGRCLACHITYGLPHVFSRHPVINLQGIIENIAQTLHISPDSLAWELEPTVGDSDAMFRIPLRVRVIP